MLEYEYDKFKYDELKQKDKFERHKYIPQLKELIDFHKDNCFVLQISGQYGSGKTFFVNLLKKYLETCNYRTLYYNAWEHDYAQDAFISFCSIFVSKFDSSSPDKHGLKKAVLDLINSNLPAMLSFCVREISGINIDKLADGVCEFAQNADENSQITKKDCNNLLDIELKRENIVNEFHDALRASVKEKTEPLVVIIDDLDRCKADFAVRLLDYIKHLFNIEGLTFVLAVDNEQLKSTIEHYYGVKNASGYLKRIVDFEFELPVADYKGYITDLITEYQVQCDKLYEDYLINLLNDLGFIFDLSLRDLYNIFEQVHTTMKKMNAYKGKPYMYFVVFIMEHYFEKYKNDIARLENIDNTKYSNSQKLVKFFNLKFASSPYYNNSLFSDLPLNKEGYPLNRRDHNLKEVLLYLLQPKVDNPPACYWTFPAPLVASGLYDKYNEKTIYDRILIDMENAGKDKNDQI